ncbi:MAG: phenylalanine--tRNA ligase subunit alpha, partial [Oscillospiraceae bacterium]
MKEALQGIEKEAQRLIAAADSSAVIEELRVRFLGKKGELTSILKQMGGLT